MTSRSCVLKLVFISLLHDGPTQAATVLLAHKAPRVLSTRCSTDGLRQSGLPWQQHLTSALLLGPRQQVYLLAWCSEVFNELCCCHEHHRSCLGGTETAPLSSMLRSANRSLHITHLTGGRKSSSHQPRLI